METTARGDVPKTLQTIAYISIPNSADLDFLLWDLQDAIAAYAQLSGTALPRPVDLKANDAGSVADGIVLAIEDVADDETLTAIEQALEKLDIGYIDMMLLHHPGTNDVQAYLAMEKYVEEGKIRSLGVSCFYIKELDNFLPQVNIKPALVQNEIHPYYQDSEVVDYIHSLGITAQCWYPLGGRGYTAELLGNETIKAIAEEHGVSAAQVILRWDLQNGVVVIPGSSNPDHIYENTQLYHFSLTDEEMAAIKALNRDEKHDWY